ncbi:hypothetical protein WOLCODRAFT_129955 [Wolfiporia cocos MD-104 SS10]|uniref:Condensation domain-containing protein n=1 Tax=Wolfiporia cocos (strain MD-104) TaxID=742152 RepID=A0A2H3J4T8_WOLCO|nr:hypothetical protein WOLCODRAFT_129955 [Wolfiporia cocos MD-104 SS10]
MAPWALLESPKSRGRICSLARTLQTVHIPSQLGAFNCLEPRDGHAPRTYFRPLSLSESGYYWDTQFRGTTDLIWHYIAETQEDSLFHPDNIVRTWVALKQQHPLMGVRIQHRDSCDAPQFVVNERNLVKPLPGELIHKTITSADEVYALIDDIIHGDQRSFSDLPVRLFVFDRTDRPQTHHVIFNTAHFLSDGVSHTILCRTFFDFLTSPPTSVPALENRLAMVVAYEDLFPARRWSISRQRWRRAIASVILSIRWRNLRGGHTIPRKITSATYRTPAAGRSLRKTLPSALTVRILDNCRRFNITLATALPVITQLATARTLHRHYLRGRIPQDEWEHRKREPMHFFLPVNLRPYLNEDWRNRDGASEVFLSVNIFYCTLPFMPACTMPTDPSGPIAESAAPALLSSMSQERFLLRCGMIKKQMSDYMKHPLFPEIVEAGVHSSVAKRKLTASRWKDALGGRHVEDGEFSSSVFGDDVTYTVGVSSGGNCDLVQPYQYPLPRRQCYTQMYPALNQQVSQGQNDQSPVLTTANQDALLRISSWETHLHVRPAYFYLGAVTTRGQLQLLLSWDGNVYDDDVVSEWFTDVLDAVMQYLGTSEDADRSEG